MTLLLISRQGLVTASLVVLLIALLSAGIAVLVVDDSPTGADDPQTGADFLFERGETVALARVSGSSETALYVNELPVSVAEALEARAEIKSAVDAWASAISRKVPNDDPSLREARENGTTDYFDNQNLPVPAMLVAHMEPWLELWQKHGADTMALANLMHRYGLLAAATKAGYSVTDEEVEARVSDYRQAVETAEVQPPTVIESSDEFTTGPIQIRVVEKTRDHKLDGYIATVGEDTYWGTILPEKIRHDTIINKWRNAETQDVQDNHDEWLAAVETLHAAALEGLSVELTDAFPLDTTLEKVEAFLQGSDALKKAEQ